MAFNAGDIVWVRWPNMPKWPGRIVTVDDLPDTATNLKEKSLGKRKLVYFFGQKNCAAVPVRHICAINDPSARNNFKVIRPDVVSAINDLRLHCERYGLASITDLMSLQGCSSMAATPAFSTEEPSLRSAPSNETTSSSITASTSAAFPCLTANSSTGAASSAEASAPTHGPTLLAADCRSNVGSHTTAASSSSASPLTSYRRKPSGLPPASCLPFKRTRCDDSRVQPSDTDDDSDYLPQGDSDNTDSSGEAVNSDGDGSPHGTDNATPDIQHYIDSAVSELGSKPKLTRKRAKHPERWTRAVKRAEKLQLKTPKSGCGEKCRLKCCSVISEADRGMICKQFWALDYDRRKEFILRQVSKRQIQRRRPKKATGESSRQRSASVLYKLDCLTGSTCDGNCGGHRVCMKFFLNTLHVSEWYIRDATSKPAPNRINATPDRRGRHPPAHKLTDQTRQLIISHIQSFPRMPSHYCRASSQKEYLEPDLSVAKMYRLFQEANPSLYDEKQSFAFQLCTYQSIFSNNFNISFYRPKKDQCLKCSRLQALTAAGDIDGAQAYRETVVDPHLARKVAVATLKAQDKERTARDCAFVQATFDLQAVLCTPHSDVSLFYYKRKLNIYNFTVLNHQNADGLCFLWPENEGRRGASEIGTCVLEFLQQLPDSAHRVSLYCDSCSGQNKNAMIAGVLLHATQTITHLQSAQVTYLEPGHTQMEVDSVHARIDSARKFKKIFAYTEWVEVCRKARSKRDYIVHQMKHKDFKNLRMLADATIGTGRNVQWRNLKVARAEKSARKVLFVKYEYEEDFKKVDVKSASESKTSLQPLYSQQLPISTEKKNDLLNLLQSGAIPKEYRGFYEDLPTSEDIDIGNQIDDSDESS